MPELPEVETVVRDLRLLLVDRTILRATRRTRKALRRPWRKAWESQLTNNTIHALERRGKWIVIHLNDDAFLVVHLGMSGQFTVCPAYSDYLDHVHFTFSLSDLNDRVSQELRFRDPRRFGSLTLFDSSQKLLGFFEDNELGPEPFDLDPNVWHTAITSTKRCLKAVLLDQRIVAGVGNIYADEALFDAKIHPGRLGNSLSEQECDRLRESIVKVLLRAIEQRGSSIRNYIGGSGLQGSYQDEFLAYGRTGNACSRCQTELEQVRLAGRSSHFCPQCQPE